MTDVDLPSWAMDDRPEPTVKYPNTGVWVARNGVSVARISRGSSDESRAEYSRLATEFIQRIHAVPAVDREHVKGIRLIRDRLNEHLAELADFDRSGVTG